MGEAKRRKQLDKGFGKSDEGAKTLGEWRAHYYNECYAGRVPDYRPTGNVVVDENVLARASLVYAARKARKGLLIGEPKLIRWLTTSY